MQFHLRGAGRDGSREISSSSVPGTVDFEVTNHLGKPSQFSKPPFLLQKAQMMAPSCGSWGDSYMG